MADPYLDDFRDPAFDAAAYLNKVLPPLQSQPASRSASAAVPLPELSSQAQTAVTHLNNHTTRLTNTLTQLTDDILRSGSRLAYEVELLRGDTLSLVESLTEGLHDDIVKFVPGGVKEVAGITEPDGTATAASLGGIPESVGGAAIGAPPNEPTYITQLRTLTRVRSRLDAVVKTFGEAMEFVFPPSELSVSSSFLSVSAPDAGGENHSTEEKGQQVLQKLRTEIADLLDARDGDPIKGIEDAAKRVAELKELNLVWKGTAEEKGRMRFIDSLAKKVEDRHKDLLRELEQSPRPEDANAEMTSASKRNTDDDDEVIATENRGYRGYNLISQLQKLRGGI